MVTLSIGNPLEKVGKAKEKKNLNKLRKGLPRRRRIGILFERSNLAA